ncbi:MAG TPA: hypothetical protein VFM37_08605 [Pseudonocardiaceae bacterium]|nr:hypothetical protein [Pseudonocardiaceae bacterium]
MAYALDDLGQAVLNQLYDLVCGCERAMPPAGASFLTWCEPGIPFEPADFDFATGDVDAASVENAFEFSRLVDFVPGPGAAHTSDRQRRSYCSNDSARLSTVYGEVLRSARVVHGGLTPDERAKVERLGALLRTTRPVVDVVTGKRRQVTENGPLLRAYNERLAAYQAAVLRCSGSRVAAQNGGRLDRDAYDGQVESGLAAWISVGYRDEVDQIDSCLDQLCGRDLVPWRRRLVELLDGAQLRTVEPDRRFPYTSPVPARFASGDCWTGHAFRHYAVDSGLHRRTRSWRAGGDLRFTLAAFGGEAVFGGETPSAFTVESFELHLELCPVLISRPWFYPRLLTSRGWTSNDLLCDGGDPPAGRLVGYPTTILFARDLRIESADFATAYTVLAGRAGEHAGIGWGPFWLGGHVSRAGRERRCRVEVDSRGLSVPGLQVIGFVNQQLGKSPNPLPGLDQGRFV